MARKGKTKGKPNKTGSLTNGISTSQNITKNGIPTPQRKHKSLNADVDYYKRTLSTYKKYMHHLSTQREWMKFKFGMKIRNIFDVVKDIQILAVGTGAGDTDIEFLKEIIHCGTMRYGAAGFSITYQVVEEDPESMQAFRNRVAQQPEYCCVKFNWFPGTFDRFVSAVRPNSSQQIQNKFHFIHFVRCFHEMNSVHAFDTTYNTFLAKHGVMCAVGESEDSFWPHMMQFLAQHQLDHERFRSSGPISLNYFLPGWLELCRQRNWRYESYIQGYKFDITPIYDSSNSDGHHLIDLVMDTKNAQECIPQNIMEDFFRFLDVGKKERFVVENGSQVLQKYYPCEFGAIMITKE